MSLKGEYYMHILIIPSSYPTEDASLRGTFFKEQAEALKEDGNKVGVIYSETRRITGINFKTFKKNHFQINEYCENGVNVIRLHGWNVLAMRNSLGINLWIKQTVKLFEIYIKKYGKPEIMHVHCGLYGGSAAKIIKEKYNIPYIITEHSSLILNNKLDSYHEMILKEAYDNADMLISVGSKLKEAMKRYTNNNIVVIPNIVDTSIFKYSNKENSKNNKFKFASVCFLRTDKNIKLLLEAFAKNFKGNDCVGLMIIGDGPEKENLIKLANELNIFGQVDFIGAVERNNLYDYLKEASSFVLPSNYETFGVAYIEALACGLPIVTTSCGGPEDFYDKQLGFMVPVGDLDALSDAMNEMINNYDKFDRENISKYIKEKFSKEVVVKDIKKVYFEILN